MKKLIAVFAVVLFVVSVFAGVDGVFKSAVYDNIVNDIFVSNENIYTATNGGIEVFWKDSTKVFENGLPWKIYQRVGSSGILGMLKKNFVSDVVSVSGRIFAINGDWLTVSGTPENHVSSVPVPNGMDLAVSSKGVVYGAAEDGLFSVNLDGTRKMISLPFGVTKIDFDCHGALWGIFKDGIVFSLDTLGAINVWRCDKELTLGVPNNIAVRNDTVVVAAERGMYIKFGLVDWQQKSWPTVINVGYYLSRKLPIPVAISRGCINIGNVNNVAFWDPKQPFAWGGGFFPGNFKGFSVINCLAADDENLYIGTDNKMWVSYGGCWLGQWPSQKSVTGICYPHGNDIRFITSMHGAIDYSDRILVSSNLCGFGGGGYYYKNNTDAPMLEGNNYCNGGEIKAVFIEKNGWYWIGRKNTLVRVNKLNQEWIRFPINFSPDDYWLVGDVNNNPWMIVSSPNNSSVWSYAGNNTWVNKLDAPANLTNQKILSASSTGKFLWIATDSAAFVYDFKGGWLSQKLSYTTNRKICGDESLGSRAWIAEGSVLYSVNGSGTTIHGPCPWKNRLVNDMIFDHVEKMIWVATDSGAYCVNTAGKAIEVPIHKLADEFVNTILIVRLLNEKQIWFGTAGGLSVRHQDNSTPIKQGQGFKSGAAENVRLSFFSGAVHFNLDKAGIVSLKVFDLRGRAVATLADKRESGKHSVSLKGLNVSRGNYLCVLEANREKSVMKISVM